MMQLFNTFSVRFFLNNLLFSLLLVLGLNKQDEKQLQELISEERQIIDKKINTLYSKVCFRKHTNLNSANVKEQYFFKIML